jgi:peptidoglycan hydrolase FlgJ
MLNSAVYTDFQSLARLRQEAGGERPSAAAIEQVATQFEALFLQMVLKSMREAGFGESMMDSEQSRNYRELFDSQLAITLANRRSLGIADLIVRQLGIADDDATIAFAEQGDTPLAISATAAVAKQTDPNLADEISPAGFVQELWEHAQQAGRSLGANPEILIAQAALETGWGKSVIHNGDGSSSFNIFGIKATSDWDGEQVAKTTVEYEGGVIMKKRAQFRSYASYAEAFDDYVQLLQSPRYEQTRAVASDPVSYSLALQQAGYATDPNYGKKINAIMGGDTLAQALPESSLLRYVR